MLLDQRVLDSVQLKLDRITISLLALSLPLDQLGAE